MDKIRTTGVIEAIAEDEHGCVTYFVKVNLNGKFFRVESVCYSESKRLPTGKNVVVDYMVSSKGVSSVKIIGEDILACEDNLAGDLRVLFGFAMLVVFVIIYYMVKK
jgi:hypothetical protein